MDSIEVRINAVKQRIKSALESANRHNETVTLLCVSKYAEIEAIAAAAKAGQSCFAENYVQPALAKIAALKDYDLQWHFIGQIQRNKTRKIAENFSWVHSVDNEKIAERLNAHCSKTSSLNVCIQVNVDNDKNKGGIPAEKVERLATFINQLSHLNLRGLMTVPQKHAKLADDRQSFHRLQQLYLQLKQKGFALDTLSMGMSADLEAAIAEGATIVRIGSAIFSSDKR